MADFFICAMSQVRHGKALLLCIFMVMQCCGCKHYNEAFFVTKFVNGLKQEIQKAIKLHKPRNIYICCF
jgi:hypothetical protein